MLNTHDLEVRELPSVFTNVEKKKKRVEFSSLELIKKNIKIRDSLNEVLLMSDTVIGSLIDNVQGDIGPLYKVSEAVALLDLVHD